MKIGFTGTRLGMSANQRSELEKIFSRIALTCKKHSFHHGDCVGADAEAAEIADKVFGMEIFCYPPINESNRAFYVSDVCYPSKPYLDRNRDIVRACDLLIAAPKTPHAAKKGGTWFTVRYARHMNKRVTILDPAG